jgi:hypothetical protein
MTGSGGVNGGAGTSVAQDSGAPDVAVDKRAMDLIELKDALKNLQGFTYTSPCLFSNNGSDVTTLAGCNRRYLLAYGGPRSFLGSGRLPLVDRRVTYDVDLNVLGVIDARLPTGAELRVPAGSPLQTISVTQCTDGFANQGSVTFNVYQFAVPTPAVKYYSTPSSFTLRIASTPATTSSPSPSTRGPPSRSRWTISTAARSATAASRRRRASTRSPRIRRLAT